MKIANLILTSQNGGAEQVFIDYTIILKDLGHDVVTIVKNDAPYADKFCDTIFNLKKITNYFGDYDFFSVAALVKIFKKEKIEIVFAHVGRSMVLARKAIRRIKNQKIILIAVNHSMNVKRSIGSDIIISVNKQIFYKTIDAGQSHKKSFVIANSIDLSDAITITPKINFDARNIIKLGTVGRLDKSKGFRHVINALSKLENFDKKFTLKIAGSGKRELYLRSLVKKLKLENRVEFCGWIKNKKEFFDGIDILIFPSQRETFGLVLLEAMKYHKPIISSNADGPKEILRDGIDALIFSIDDHDDAIAQELAELIKKLSKDQDLATKLVKNSFTRLQEKFSSNALKENLQNLIGK
jgi:glycosyltransferase involved in cell wall biosynthesis